MVMWLMTSCDPKRSRSEYVESFTYLGSVISSDGDVEADINTRLAKATLDNMCWFSTLSLKIKLGLYTSLIVSTAPYASETSKSTARICQQLDVFHQHNLRKILGITWKDHMTNMEVQSRTGQRRLQDIVAERRLRMAGHIIRMPPGRPANRVMSWNLVVVADDDVVQRRLGGLHKEDLVDWGVNCNSVRAVATNRSRWRTLAAHCLVKDRRIYVLSAKYFNTSQKEWKNFQKNTKENDVLEEYIRLLTI